MFLSGLASVVLETKRFRERQEIQPITKAHFTITGPNGKFECENCGNDEFIKVSTIKVRCPDCEAVYSVEFDKVEVRITFYR